MAVIDKAGSGDAAQFGFDAGVWGDVLGWVRGAIADDMWRWLDANLNTVVLNLQWWVITVKVKGRHLKPLFVVLFGARR